MIFIPCLILSLLVVGRARLDEYRAVRNAVEELLDVSVSTPCPSNGTHHFIFKQDQTGLDRSARSTLDFGAKGLKVSRSQGLMVSRSQGLKV